MATLHVRNVPDLLYQRLRERAEAQNRSLSAEIIVLLNQALSEPATDQAALLESIRRLRASVPALPGAPDSVTLIREDRER